SEPRYEGQRESQAHQRAVSDETSLLPYLAGATVIELQDPYMRQPRQGRNLVELLAVIASAKDPAEEVTFRLTTCEDPDTAFKQKQLLMLKEIYDQAPQ